MKFEFKRRNNMKIEKFILSIGLNDKNTKQQKFDMVTNYKIIENILKNYTDGYTIYECKGGYKHDSGFFVQEKTLRAELLFTGYETIKKIVQDLKVALNQESIAVEKFITISELL